MFPKRVWLSAVLNVLLVRASQSCFLRLESIAMPGESCAVEEVGDF